jgi:DNA mismatch repair protein MutL
MKPDGHVRVLPPDVVNKIAAGEVVDRPASVLKELLENAVDAGATQIDCEVVAGGRRLIAVADNGGGMGRDDALLSVERHATSKIRDVNDIESIATLGFRGEALAAIASVSRFRLATCRTGESVGSEILITGGHLQDVRDIGCPAGTVVEVRDLFFNVPARRKFLRAPQTEMVHVRNTFVTQALARAELGLQLKVDGRTAHALPGGASLSERIQELFGADYARQLASVDHSDGEIRVTGFAGLPALGRTDRSEQFVFINRRATVAPALTYAVREAYRTLLPDDRYPVLFLFIEMPPGEVDVNVHPTKREVRFRNSGQVRDAVLGAMRQALGRSPVGGGPLPRPGAPALSPGMPPAAPAAVAQPLKIDDLPAARAFRYPKMPLPGRDPVPSPAPASPTGSASPAPAAGAQGLSPSRFDAPWSWCRVIGQVGGLYVVMETEDGLVLMDPHAAHERVLFDRFMAAWSNGKAVSQSLLIPETVELRPADAHRVRQSLEALASMGFGISEFGGDTFVVDAMPALFAGAKCAALLIEIAHDLEIAGTRGGKERWREETIAQAACKAAVKARHTLTLQEIEQLVVDLARTEMPYTCPHGRPTLIFTAYRELNKKFGRE